MTTEKTFQATPTLMIGLGGTGMKVATYVKKSLYEINGNRLPDQMAIMVIDTEAKAQFSLGGGTQERDERNATGSVRIEGGEYFALTGDVKALGEKIKKEQIEASSSPGQRSGQPHRHMSNWFQARYYIDKVGVKPSVWNMDVGAGRLRQFGRLGLFNRYTQMTQLLLDNLRAIRASGAKELYVHVAGSLAGGTGAALFIDIAHLVLQYASQAGISQTPVVFGHFVLPEAFRGTPEVELYKNGVRADFDARAFAALRELTRLRGTTPANSDGYPIIYKPDGTGPERASLKNFYSAVYLYDGRCQRNPLNTLRVEMGLAPSIADAIVAYIDDRSSDRFVKHSVNYDSFYHAFNLPDGLVTYGTIGTYTIELPIYHITEGWSHQLARQVLDTLLQPAQRDQTSELPLVLANDQVQDHHNPDAKQAAAEWLRLDNTAMVRQLAEWGKQARIETSIARQQAIKSVLNLDAGTWLQNLVPTDSEARDLTAQAESELQGSLKLKKETNGYYIDHSGVSGDSAASRADTMRTDIEVQMKKMLGRMSTAWQREGGNFGQALNRLSSYHVKRFYQALQKRLHEVLNGDPNQGTSEVRKRGKLGYMIAFLQEANSLLKGCTQLLVEATRQSEAERKPLFDRSFNELQADGTRMAQANWLTEANARAKYRDKADELAQFHKADIARQVAYGLLGQLQGLVDTTLNELELWQRNLALGTATDGGAYGLLLEGQRNISVDRQTLANAVRWVIGDQESHDTYISSKYDQYSADRLEELLRLVEWSFTPDRDGRLRVAFSFAGQAWERQAGNTNQRIAGIRNLATLVKRCREVYRSAWTEMSVVQYLRTNFADNEQALAEKIYQATGFPLELEPTKSEGEPRKKTTFLRVYKDKLEAPDFTFLQRLRGEVAVKLGSASRQATDRDQDKDQPSADGEDSRDPFKLSFVLFGDLIKLDEIKSAEEARDHYRNRVDEQWRQLHILPAETNALQIETQMSSGTLKQRRRELCEEVVTVLEDTDRFHLAMQCLAYGQTDFAWSQGQDTGVLLHKHIAEEDNERSWSHWRLTVAPEGDLRADDRIYNALGGLAVPTHYALSQPAPEPDLVQALIQLTCRSVDRVTGEAIEWDAVPRTLKLMMKRNNQHWAAQQPSPWIPQEHVQRTPRLQRELSDKAAQIIRLYAYIDSLKKNLNKYPWAWRQGASQPSDKDITPDQRIAVQQLVDLLTALHVEAVQENAVLSMRFNELAQWKGQIPADVVNLDFGVSDKGSEPPPPPPNQWSCTNCNTPNDNDDLFCAECGTDRPGKEPPPPPPPPPPAKRVCEEGHPLPDDAAFCPKCGKPEHAHEPPPPPKRVCEDGHPLPDDAAFCPKCGKRERAPEPPDAQRVCEEGHSMPNNAVFCPKCGKRERAPEPPDAQRVCEEGHPLPNNAVFCPKCGKRERAPEPPPPPKRVCEEGHPMLDDVTFCTKCGKRERVS